MEGYDLTAASLRAAAEMIGTTGPVSPSSTYDALVELLAAAYREGVMAGLQRAKDILDEKVGS